MTRHVAIGLLLAACGDDPAGGSRALRAAPIDFTSGAPIDGDVTVVVEGLAPTRAATVTGGTFVVTGVPDHSIVDLVVAGAGVYRATRSTVELDAADLDVAPRVITEAALAQLAADVGVTMTPERGVALLHVATPDPATDLAFDGDAVGPFPLADDWVAYFEVAPGLPLVTASPTASGSFDAQLAITAGTVTIAELAVRGTPEALPAPLRFAEHVVPILDERGCTACHDGLAAHAAAYVTLAAPTSSALLAMPSRSNAGHPNVVFAGPNDLAYRTILQWIAFGAKTD
ncbi:MAG: hypothetical protein NT062_11455 [Proteobacteria bacterium]|nr:hypothetical protein [Pseudomonadota bacterium]